jgi:hypothetical protein
MSFGLQAGELIERRQTMHRSRALAFLMVAVFFGCGIDTDRAEIRSVVTRYVEAVKSNDDDAVRDVTTESMYDEYCDAKAKLEAANALLGDFGVAPTSFTDVELVNVDVEKIQGSSAYVAVDSKLRERTSFERLILKKEDGRWRLAGKQR